MALKNLEITQLKEDRLRKIRPSSLYWATAYSTNIYRMWIPENGKAISTTDTVLAKLEQVIDSTEGDYELACALENTMVRGVVFS